LLRPERELVQHGHVEFAVQGERDRPRDGRRAHHQQIHVAPLLLDLRPLDDAKAVLLVDDDQAQRAERHRLLDQRVRPDKQVNLSRLDGFSQRALGRRGAGQESGPHGQAFERPRKVRRVLLGQDLRRRHERRLEPGFDRPERSHHGHEGLARAHVALQEPHHPQRPREVAPNLPQRSLL